MTRGLTTREIEDDVSIVIPPYQSQVKGTALESPIDLEEYMVGPGDGFLISISGLEPTVIRATVSPGEKLMIPGIGMVDVGGMSAVEAELAALALIKQMNPSYKAYCSLYGIREVKISVTGAVNRPDFYKLTPVSRLSDALRLAGGWKSLAALKRIRIRRGNGEIVQVDYTKFIDSGDLAHNPRLAAGDGINVPLSNIASETMVIGGLASPSVYQTVREGQSLLSFMSGWYTPKTRASIISVDVIRKHNPSNLVTIAADEFAGFIIEPGDEIYIKTVAAIHLVGQVRKPGRYNYQPGLRASDYIALAAGVSSEGSKSKVMVTHMDGSVESGKKVLVQAGDIVLVPKSVRSVLVGQTGVIQVVLAVLNMYLAFLAASK